MTTNWVDKVFESFEVVDYDNIKGRLLVTNITFQKDKREWIEQLLLNGKKMLQDNLDLRDEVKENILNLLKFDLFDGNIYIYIHQCFDRDGWCSFHIKQFCEIYITFFNLNSRYYDNVNLNLNDFDSLYISSCYDNLLDYFSLTKEPDFIYLKTHESMLKPNVKKNSHCYLSWYVTRIDMLENNQKIYNL